MSSTTFIKAKEHVVEFAKNPFKDHNRAFNLLLGICAFALLLVVFICNQFGGFLNYGTDDIVQYYPFMAGFIEKLKNGNIGFFDSSFYVGSSFFANSYYIPLDIFTFLTFIFSLFTDTEVAYFIVNVIKPMSGGLLLFYVLKKQGFKPTTCFISSFIYTFTGLYITFCVFPVYHSLMFYIPLAVYVADRFRENTYNFWMVVLYTVVVVFYNFYLAYMLLAFYMIYLCIISYAKDDFSIIGENSFILNRRFYKQILLSIGLIAIGMVIGLVYFLPNFLYITGHTFRDAANVILSHFTWKHYITIFTTYFIAGNPIQVLNPFEPGLYITDHASMFMTIFGLIFLVHFFFLKGREFNRLKFFVILFNVLLCIPLVAVIFSASDQPYIRWFFIVYFINLYAATIAMDKMEYCYYKDDKTKIITWVTLLVAFVFIFFAFFASDDYKLYKENSGVYYFYPILIIFVLSLILYVIPIFVKKLKMLPLITVCLEVIASAVIIYTNCGNSNPYYAHSRELLDYTYNNLLNNTSFNPNGAFKATMTSYESNYLSNASFMYEKLNSERFFHSFYDSTINGFYTEVMNQGSGSWTRRQQDMNEFPLTLQFGVKYHIVPKDETISLPSGYKFIFDDGNFKYYELEDMKPFIVYDEFLEPATGTMNYQEKAMVLANYGSFGVVDNTTFNKLMNEYNLTSITTSRAKNRVSSGKFVTIPSASFTTYNNMQYMLYDLKNYASVGYDTHVFSITNSDFRDDACLDAFVMDSDGNTHKLYNGMFNNTSNLNLTALYVRTDKSYVSSVNYLRFNFDEFFDTYLDKQSAYTNEVFTIENDQMHLSFDMESSDTGRIVKTNYAYSSEWKPNGDYETIKINGGFLGIIIPPNTSHVDVTLDFVPDGYVVGSSISAATLTVFIVATGVIFVTRRKENSDNLYIKK